MNAKLMAAAGLMLLWFVLVMVGKAPANQFVDGILQALTGLGVYHSVTNRSSLS